MASRNAMAPPFQDKIIETTGLASRPWIDFFRAIFERLNPLGIEQSCKIYPHASDVYNAEGLVLNSQQENFVIIDYIIQRVSSDEEKVECGTLYCKYNPKAQTWTMTKPISSGASDVTLSILNSGQIQYQAPAITGTVVIEKMSWRARSIYAKVRG